MAKKQQYLDLNQSFYVGSRFCDLQPLGFGGGGQVYSAVDVEGDKCVAIKKVILADQKNCKVQSNNNNFNTRQKTFKKSININKTRDSKHCLQKKVFNILTEYSCN